jgi:hypothetical protein
MRWASYMFAHLNTYTPDKHNPVNPIACHVCCIPVDPEIQSLSRSAAQPRLSGTVWGGSAMHLATVQVYMVSACRNKIHPTLYMPLYCIFSVIPFQPPRSKSFPLGQPLSTPSLVLQHTILNSHGPSNNRSSRDDSPPKPNHNHRWVRAVPGAQTQLLSP